MAVFDTLNTAVNSSAKQDPLASVSSMREAFQDWLVAGNAKKYSPEYILINLDRISEYANRKKLSTCSIWEHTKQDVFKHIYNKLLEEKLLRITDRNAHKVFIITGQLYLRFLNEKPWEIVAVKTANSGDAENAKRTPNKLIVKVQQAQDNVVDLDTGKTGIREILKAHFQTLYGYSNINILWNAAQDTLSMFLNDNAINNADDLWSFMQCAFSDECVLSNPHIWKSRPNYPQSYVGVIINLARQLGCIVKREQIDEYFARIKQGSPINATIIRQGLLMFYENKHFILAEAVNLTSERCAEITKSLDRLFEHEQVPYIVLRDITEEWFSSLPALKGGIKWTALLLQEVLRLRPNIGYSVIFSGLDGQALDTLGAAIVPSNSDIKIFADVVHRYCHEREILGKKMVAEDLRAILREAGMIEGNQLIYNLHKALKDYRFAFTDENKMVKILER